MINEMTIMIKVKSGKRTELDVSGYHYGQENKMIIGDNEYSKSEITEGVISNIKGFLKRVRDK